ncbi:hypothetical protein ABFS82_14G046600 [Erythranthe guttata]|uniref:Ricin B lectin domain-containing protein n=1 Tax=Erythranthe guttata TaxID=4155 RepID=A0A022QY03_ERYGU|nr:PREDICTED: uncharacterized protein LOC105963200 [Erythranthe guttata]EYU32796.1 hypothetical protein MIMGU_mgv1a011218mg [Erythranthe guttata]|eukprot:XP_012843038.1 PREDICTED: uncharacterized protein LOC105963200 [Erythranthe guttata]
MDYPHGNHRPHHGRDRRDEEEEDHHYPPPGRPHPQPFYGGNEYDPPPPQVYYPDSYPPPPFYGGNDPPPPPQVYHTSHSGPGPDSYPSPPSSYSEYSDPPPPPPPSAEENKHHRPHMPHFPSIIDHHKQHKEDQSAKKPAVRMYCKGETNYSLTIRDGKVILARSDPSDPLQHWIKDEKWSTKVKDEEGFPSFALVNKATGQAMKHSTGATQPVQLTPYNADVLDESILWTESRDLGDSYRAIRMVNNIRLNVDAFNGDQNHGGVHDGTTIVLWEWKKGDNQRWKIVPH